MKLKTGDILICKKYYSYDTYSFCIVEYKPGESFL